MAVVEGAARDVPAPDGVTVVRTPGSGDDALVGAAAGDGDLLVVTADRGLRARLPGVATSGPGWLLDLLDAAPGD